MISNPETYTQSNYQEHRDTGRLQRFASCTPFAQKTTGDCASLKQEVEQQGDTENTEIGGSMSERGKKTPDPSPQETTVFPAGRAGSPEWSRKRLLQKDKACGIPEHVTG